MMDKLNKWSINKNTSLPPSHFTTLQPTIFFLSLLLSSAKSTHTPTTHFQSCSSNSPYIQR
ncbi:hypothetical protein HanIR_Chr10g0472741 [Helianthus annuus]|nr:hypothetical protein HanIR_Chr10g0472741 [Helianthus annuus]